MTDDREKRPARGRRKSSEPSGREMLLRSALKHFARCGYDGASLRIIATDAGVDMALVARLFGSKDRLWHAVIADLDQSRAHYRDAMQALTQIKDSQPVKAFREMMELFGKVSLEMPDLLGLMLQEANNPGARQDTVMQFLITPFRNDCKPIIEACIAAKKLRATNADVVFGILSSAIILPLLLPQLCGRKTSSRKRLRADLVCEAMSLLITE